jgi:hypothetical protein
MDTMQLTYRAQAFTMAFCLNCHRNPEQFIRTPDQIWNMEWQPSADQKRIGQALVAQAHLRPAAQLTDCSTCHR